MKLAITTKELTYTALFTALISIGAFIKIPLPFTPFTLQPIFILLSSLLLGKKLGILAVSSYVIIGLIGFPIFAAGGGLGYVFQPSFGYLLGFILCAFIIGTLDEKIKHKSFWIYLLFCIIGTISIYAIGLPYLYIVLTKYLHITVSTKDFLYTYTLFLIPKDLISCIFVAFLVHNFGANIKRL
ncbi:MAG: biotin transporter BioY [Culicoidibacterales bacterium]